MNYKDKLVGDVELAPDAPTWLVQLAGSLQNVDLTLPLFRVVLSPTVTRPFCAVPRTSVARTASG